jgi:hypothetical protein
MSHLHFRQNCFGLVLALEAAMRHNESHFFLKGSSVQILVVMSDADNLMQDSAIVYSPSRCQPQLAYTVNHSKAGFGALETVRVSIIFLC